MDTLGRPPNARVCDAVVVARITLDAPLTAASLDGVAPEDSPPDPFASVYREYTVVHAVTGNQVGKKGEHSNLFDPTPRRNKRRPTPAGIPHSATGTSSHVVASEVLQTVPTFCFPDGAQVLPEKPPPSANTSHSFIISESGYYATCVIFYRKEDARPFWLAYECLYPRQQEPRTSVMPLRAVSEGGEPLDLVQPAPRQSWIYLPYCICLVSRLPYFGVMKNVLTSVLPNVQHNFETLGPFLEELMADITRVPPPPPGRAAVAFKLHPRLTALKPRYILCKPPRHPNLPIIDVPLRFTFLKFAPEQIITILVALMTEQRIIFMSSDYALLTPVIEGILSLMYPLQWAHVYIPVIPAHLRALVEVPWPFLVGVHSRYSEDILGVFDERAPESEEPMIVNLDTRSVLVPDAITLPSLPAASIAMFTDRCLDLPLDYEMWCASSSFPHPETDEGARAFHAEHLQKEIQELGLSLMIDILGDVRRHMLFDVSPPIFDLDKFLAAQPPESRDFFRTLCNNGSFRSFQRSRHQHELDFFDIMVAENAVLSADVEEFVFNLPDFHNVLERRRSEGELAGLDLAAPLAAASAGATRTLPRRSTLVAELSDDGLTTPQRSYARYCQQTIAKLTHLLDRPRCPCKGELLHLRGLFRVWAGDLMKGLDDFGAIWKVNAGSFPASLVLAIVEEHPREVQDEIAKKSPRWRDLIATLHTAALGSDLLGVPEVEDDGVKLPEIGGEAELRSAIENGVAIDLENFIIITKLFRVTDDTGTANRLFQSLMDISRDTEDSGGAVVKEDETDDDDDGEGEVNKIGTDLLTEFVEIWRSLADVGDDPVVQQALRPDEVVLKSLPLVRRSDIGMGTLYMTQHRLLMKKNNADEMTEVVELSRIFSADKLQYKLLIPPGVPAIKIFSGDPAKDPKKDGRRPSVTPTKHRRNNSNVDVVQQMLLFFTKRDEWHAYIMEMALAHRAAVTTKDPALILKGAENVTLAEAIAKLIQHRIAADQKAAENWRGPVASAAPTVRLLTYTNPDSQSPERRVVRSAVSSAYYVKKVDSSPNQVKKSTVECMLFLPAPNGSTIGTVWCGLGSGFIQVLKMPSGVCESRMKPHKDRVTCLLAVGETVWSSSFDATIRILDVRTRRTVAVLEDNDAIGSLLLDGDSVWSCTLSGLITEWGRESHEKVRCINVSDLRGKFCSLRSMCRIGPNSLWVGTGTVIVVINLETGGLLARPETPTTPDLEAALTEAQEEFTAALASQLTPTRGFVDEAMRSKLKPNNSMLTDIDSHTRRHSAPLPQPDDPGQVATNDRFVTPASPKCFSDDENEAKNVIIRTLASHCIVAGCENEVWSCSNVSGLLHVWDTTRFAQSSMGGEWMIDCDGFNVLLATASAIWGGANNGSVYMWDIETHSLLRELTTHSDGVRSLCEMQHFVVSGSGSKDGTLVVWKTAR